MATFILGGVPIDFPYQFTFINHTKHHPIHYQLGSVTDGVDKEHREVKAGDTVKSHPFLLHGPLKRGDASIVRLHNAPELKFQISSTSNRQSIKPIAEDGYTVTQDTPELSEVVGNGFRVTVDGGGKKNPTTSDIYIQIYPHHESKPHHPHPWHEVHGKNSYCHCACPHAGNNKEKHYSHHTMTVKKGAPYLYAVLTKDKNSIEFPHGAVLSIIGPGGEKYDHHLEEKNKLVIMSGASVRFLIIKHPKPGDWKLTMTAPKGVGFHCECDTVPSKDVYDTITDTLSNSLEKMALTQEDSVELENTEDLGFWGIGLLASGLWPTKNRDSSTDVHSLWMAASVDLDSHPVSGNSVEIASVDERVNAFSHGGIPVELDEEDMAVLQRCEAVPPGK